MTIRQKVLQSFYPFLMRLARKKRTVLVNETNMPPPQPFYHLQTTLNNGSRMNFELLKGKKVLLVNTASDCGYTAQYKELQQLHQQYKGKLMVLGFPSNDFKNQEQLNDEQIISFCQKQYGVRFPLAQKSVVRKMKQQNEVYFWLSHEVLNGWNNQAPTWNFSKYLVSEQGVLTHYFGPSVSPLSHTVIEAINQ